VIDKQEERKKNKDVIRDRKIRYAWGNLPSHAITESFYITQQYYLPKTTLKVYNVFSKQSPSKRKSLQIH
jgi:Gpi18-like mannosyltransferase